MKQIIFDCDGVLVDSEIEAAKAMVSQLKLLGIDINLEYHLRNHAGRTYKTIFLELLEKEMIPDHLDISALIQRIEKDSYANIEPIAHISSTLEAIILPKAVVSNSAPHQIEHALSIAGISQHFKGNLFSATMVSKPKPNPAIYHLASKTLGVSSPECFVIEDSLTGVKAAKAAGMLVLGFIGASHILPGHGDKLVRAGAIKIFEDMRELPGLIAGLA